MAHRFDHARRDTAAATARRRQYASRQHRDLRAAWQRRIDSGERVVCTRQLPGCVGLIRSGTAWHLDHTDDRTGYRGPACVGCNQKAAARKGNRVARRQAIVSRRAQSRAW